MTSESTEPPSTEPLSGNFEEYIDAPLNDVQDDEPVAPTKKKESLLKWAFAVIFLAIVSLCSGTVNIFPSIASDMQTIVNGLSNSLATFTFTAGVMIMYITLPTGLFLDKFGAELTWIISSLLTVISSYILPYTKNSNVGFIILFIIMAFGNSSIFITGLQLVIARSPDNIRGVCTSIVSASLSLAFGLWLQIYLAGGKVFKCTTDCSYANLRFLSIINPTIVLVFAPIAWLLFRQFGHGEEPKGNESSKPHEPMKYVDIFKNPKLYVLLFMMLSTVFDGLSVISGGDYIWNKYGKGYPGAAAQYGIAFSVVNCIFTILLSILLDYLIAKTKTPRRKLISLFWLIYGMFPLLVGIVFKTTDNEILFVVFMSAMGIPFGFGLTHIPALTSEIFGNENYGFAFGIIQFGSIISAACAMPIIQILNHTSIVILFMVLTVLHILESGIWYFLNRPSQKELTLYP